ncbi:hypothetical protein BPAE_0060g00260 [Botrytis paeoniae]|uniref:Uncharacterized protein n=1 Tax=Botrytis paeoniae TaxID=278948 RepID=A0A4Z1FSW8_9HELO|nr:hypothetical protein BPAE_0060g00260 [Botrytis paeoniae]
MVSQSLIIKNLVQKLSAPHRLLCRTSGGYASALRFSTPSSHRLLRWPASPRDSSRRFPTPSSSFQHSADTADKHFIHGDEQGYSEVMKQNREPCRPALAGLVAAVPPFTEVPNAFI